MDELMRFASDVLVPAGMLYFIFFVVIAFHEASHFTVARLLGIKVEYILVGIPPLLALNLKGVKIRLGLMPLGGGVSIKNLFEISTRKRLLIYGFGPAASWILAMVPLIIIGGVEMSLVYREFTFGFFEAYSKSPIPVQESSAILSLTRDIQVYREATGSLILPIVVYGSIISMMVTLFNVIPFPQLDGGFITLTIFEVILGKRFQTLAKVLVWLGGFVLLGYSLIILGREGMFMFKELKLPFF